MITDTHCHLYLPEFQDDISDVVALARKKGVARFFLPNIDSGSIPTLKNLCSAYPGEFFPLMGLHPCSVKENYANELETIKKELFSGGYYGVGEIGRDYYWDKTFTGAQKELFRTQISWAIELKLPIIIHTRDSLDDALELVEAMKTPELKGIFHCFSGSPDQAKRVMNLGGFKMGIGGVLTFKNSGLDKTVAQIPLEYLVLETDAPYLAPVPYRGKRNEPAFLDEIIGKLSEVKSLSREEIISVTHQNSLEVFGV